MGPASRAAGDRAERAAAQPASLCQPDFPPPRGAGPANVLERAAGSGHCAVLANARTGGGDPVDGSRDAGGSLRGQRDGHHTGGDRGWPHRRAGGVRRGLVRRAGHAGGRCGQAAGGGTGGAQRGSGASRTSCAGNQPHGYSEHGHHAAGAGAEAHPGGACFLSPAIRGRRHARCGGQRARYHGEVRVRI